MQRFLLIVAFGSAALLFAFSALAELPSSVCIPQREICNGRDDDCDGQVDNGFDRDGDGYTTCRGDCDDRNPHVHPDAVELCDGIDNNCNGLIDEGFSLGSACSVGTGECRRTGVWRCAASGGDARCDAQPRGPQIEQCNGLDDDCDGEVDEDAVGTGQPCAVGIGACRRNGKTACAPDGTGLMCDAQAGAPQEEVCGNGIDDDCNGVIDTDTPNLGAVCQNGLLGACLRDGRMVCDSAKGALICDAMRPEPRKEICNGIDDDCDGQIDNGVLNACGTCDVLPHQPGQPCMMPGGDECSVGFWSCDSEHAGGLQCTPRYELSEHLVCGSDDNACTLDQCRSGRCEHVPLNNGAPCDDGNACTDRDHCMQGMCVGGTQLSCDDRNQCTQDSCHEDSGCAHERIAQGFRNACGGCGALPAPVESECHLPDQRGRCAAGRMRCLPQGDMACVQEAFPIAEVCNGIDDNCDGVVDDGFGTLSCGVGMCARTVPTCHNGESQRCVPGDPQPERCDNSGRDDDCNGVIDDVAGLDTECVLTREGCMIAGRIRCADASEPRCIALHPFLANDDDGDGRPNACDVPTTEGLSRQMLNVAALDASGKHINAAATRAVMLPWKRVSFAAMLNSFRNTFALIASPEDNQSLALMSFPEKKDDEIISRRCSLSGSQPLTGMITVDGDSVVLARRHYYQRLSAKILENASVEKCHLEAEVLGVDPWRDDSAHPRLRCQVTDIVQMASWTNGTRRGAVGLVRCQAAAGDAPRLGLDLFSWDERGAFEQQFVFLPDPAEATSLYSLAASPAAGSMPKVMLIASAASSANAQVMLCQPGLATCRWNTVSAWSEPLAALLAAREQKDTTWLAVMRSGKVWELQVQPHVLGRVHLLPRAGDDPFKSDITAAAMLSSNDTRPEAMWMADAEGRLWSRPASSINTAAFFPSSVREQVFPRAVQDDIGAEVERMFGPLELMRATRVSSDQPQAMAIFPVRNGQRTIGAMLFFYWLQ